MRARSSRRSISGHSSRRQRQTVLAAVTVATVTTIFCTGYLVRVGRTANPTGSEQILAEPQSKLKGASSCKENKQTEYWGDVVKWGTTHKVASAQQCCQACRNHVPQNGDDQACNVWVYCGDETVCGPSYQECWLKHLIALPMLQFSLTSAEAVVELLCPHADGVNPKAQGPDVPWTSGIVRPPVDQSAQAGIKPGTRQFHVIISAAGFATHWQSRVCHFQYRRVKAACEAAGSCEMGGFTRLLHEGKPDELMEEIPTFVADPLPAEQAPNDGFIVLNRPYAFLQWVQKATISEKYVLMSEPDHLWLKPLSNIMLGERPIAFPFFYIEPWKDDYLAITQKHVGPITKRQAEEIAPIGNAPTLLSWKDLEKVSQEWLNTSLAIYNDKESKAAWGWVQEMYGFTLAAYKVGLGHVDLHRDLMSQPPWDSDASRFNILHYTYGMDYALNGTFTPGVMGEWRFDKRSYGHSPPPRNLPQPPDGMKNDLVRALIDVINNATEAIPGWDEYVTSGRASHSWNGSLPS